MSFMWFCLFIFHSQHTVSMPYLVDVYQHYGSFIYDPLPLCGPLHEVIYGNKKPSEDGLFTVIPRGKIVGPTDTGHSVSKKEDFLINFNEFTSGLFSELNWDNVLVIGGAVVSSLLGSIAGFEKSDVDIYIYGITDESKFRDKVQEITESILTAAGEDVSHIIVRTPYTITIGFGWPVRNIQIIIAPWNSPEHVLSTCDIEPTAVGFNGLSVLTTRRSRFSYNKRCLVANERSVVVRGKKHYPLRMAKYALRGFMAIDPEMSENEFINKLPELDWVPKRVSNQREINLNTAPGDLSTSDGKLIHPGDIKLISINEIRIRPRGERYTFVPLSNIILNKPPVLNADPDNGCNVDVRLSGSDMAIHCGRVACQRLRLPRKAVIATYSLSQVLPSDLVALTLELLSDATRYSHSASKIRLSYPCGFGYNRSSQDVIEGSMPYGKGVTLDDIENWATIKERQSSVMSLVDPYSKRPGKYEIIRSDYLHLTKFEPLLDPFPNDCYRSQRDCDSEHVSVTGENSKIAKTYRGFLAADQKIEDVHGTDSRIIKSKLLREENLRLRTSLYNSYRSPFAMYYYDDYHDTDCIASYAKQCKKKKGSLIPGLWKKKVKSNKQSNRVADKARHRDRFSKQFLCTRA